ncbi:MAG: YidC/Oxa1 family membrane protein insertase [Patescibacteria group bacterium]|jgi:membrane protein insertase Oxa1/YidC/SpoIIIJ
MLNLIWYNFLFQPLFNALIWIYVNVAGENLGWAVVWLTVFLRVILLPLTIIALMNTDRREKAEEEARKAMLAFKNDRIAQSEAARSIMKKYRISPWAKVLTLAIQFLVLILLYQVFLQGITGEKVIKTLYPIIDYPGKINISFYGFDIGYRHDYLWAGLATLYLIISTLIGSRHQKHWSPSDMYFIIFFPIFTFVALWYLPMVKSLFILTTMIFTDMIKAIHYLTVVPKKKNKKASLPSAGAHH